MRRLFTIAAVVLAAGSVMLVRGGMQAPGREQEPEKKLIDLKSDNMGPVAPGDSVIFLVGNFAAQHNGAVITCDSAVRYSDMRIEFFGNVLINKNTTYIYGDRAVYDGEVNEARVFSDIVKVVDGDATLYTYQFLFNTKDNIGEFADGGVMLNRENRLESVRGYYYADTKDLICVERVEMRNDEYELKGDSVVYNMATDNAFFFENTNIWSRDGDYLYADRGSYDKADTLYKVTRSGYVLTEKQEMWSDSIDYYRAKDHVILRRDIQIDDTEHKVLAFGDYGEYWKEPGDAFLTRRPAIVSYDLSQGDSLFMRADSMFLFTVNENARRRAAEAAKADSLARLQADSAASARPDSVTGGGLAGDSAALAASGHGLQKGGVPDSLASAAAGPGTAASAGADSLGAAHPSMPEGAVDSLSAQVVPADSLAGADTLTVAERKVLLKEAARKAKAEQKAAAAKAKKEKLDEIAARRKEKNTAKLLAQKEREEERLAAKRKKAEAKLKARQERAARKGKVIPVDSAVLRELDSLIERNMTEQDSLLNLLVDSLLADTTAMAIPADSVDSPALPADSVYRLMKGYRNVRIYRSDFQTVCDSIVGISTDSTIHLYIEPVLWNQSNQITSDVMDIFTANQQIVRAEFIGSPMMVGQLDTVHYNQVAGKTMTAFFHNNEIYRNDVNGNAQTIYYMQDGEPPEITMMGVIESGDCSFYIEDKQVVQIVYRNDITDAFYPMDKIPPTQELYLKGFKWEGARRPAQADVFDRRIRPSERERRSQMRHPDFPIMQRIEEHKKRLIEQRSWIDRNDQVDAATVEWMRELGYEVGQPREGNRPPEASE
ncbi:OstA-like protein [uncultured Alistipes sp.]|uniref:OstA-like protein n=1 Tax=uncultured Alistipes sp. TaxID=538949 RepID=UPI00260304DC|nr:OstA-like protein [uncultured Alistipes sp.]